MDVPPLDAEMIDTLAPTRVVAYLTGASITLLTYDTLLTLGREIETVWKGRWTLTKILYLITRYSAFAESAVLLYVMAIPGDDYARCTLAFKANIMLFLVGLSIGEIVMTIRTWAVWGRGQVLMYSLSIFYFVVIGGCLVSTVIFLRDLRFDPDPLTPYLGCHATHTNPIIVISWILLTLYDSVMFVLMAIPAFHAYRAGGSSHLVRVVLRDGLLYYAYLFTLSLANIILTLTLSESRILLLSLLSRMLHAVLTCRVVLDLHDLGRRVLYTDDESRVHPGIQPSIDHRNNAKPSTPETYAPIKPDYYPSS